MIEVWSWSAILKLSILFCRFSEAFSAEFIREYERENKCDHDEFCTQISNIVSIFLLQHMEMQELGIWRFLRIRRWNARDWVQGSSWEYPSRGKCWISTLVFKSLLLGLLLLLVSILHSAASFQHRFSFFLDMVFLSCSSEVH
jgi:hypothetical protein